MAEQNTLSRRQQRFWVLAWMTAHYPAITETDRQPLAIGVGDEIFNHPDNPDPKLSRILLRNYTRSRSYLRNLADPAIKRRVTLQGKPAQAITEHQRNRAAWQLAKLAEQSAKRRANRAAHKRNVKTGRKRLINRPKTARSGSPKEGQF